MLDEKTRWYMDKRWLIVVDGLTDEEREAYNVKYSDGETLDKKQFAKITEMGDKILDIYPKLCREHQIMIAKRFAEVNENGKKKLSRDLVVALNNLSKKFGNKKGDFVAIIEAMNNKELDEE
jgi:galactitol-specific phosphotransferase system IIB component